MQETNESLGSYLKNKREGGNISIEQVAYATRISLKMLRALEEDQHTALPAPTFVRGYLQAYAKYVRIDTQDLLLRYQHHLATAPDTKKANIRSHYLYVRERYQEKRRLVLVIVLFAAMLAVAGTYFLLKAKREKNKELAQQAEQIQKSESVAPPVGVAAPEQPPASPETKPGVKPETKPVAVDAKPEDTKPAPASPAPTPTPAPTPPTPAPAALAEPVAPATVERPKDEKKTYNLLLRAEEDVWLRFQTDQDAVRDLTLRAGKAIMLRADTVIKIFSGNLGGLKPTMNGAPMATLASDKKSKSVVLPEGEASKHPLPLFPQFQTTTRPAEGASAPQNSPPASEN
jgi:cytoskeleton protein RodZ